MEAVTVTAYLGHCRRDTNGVSVKTYHEENCNFSALTLCFFTKFSTIIYNICLRTPRENYINIM